MYVGGYAPEKLSCLSFNEAGILSQIHGLLIWLVSSASLTQESRLSLLRLELWRVCVGGGACVCAMLTYEGCEDLKSCPICMALIKKKNCDVPVGQWASVPLYLSNENL